MTEAWRRTLCEDPTSGGRKCVYIGFVPGQRENTCMRFKEPISKDSDGWMSRCSSCRSSSGYSEL